MEREILNKVAKDNEELLRLVRIQQDEIANLKVQIDEMTKLIQLIAQKTGAIDNRMYEQVMSKFDMTPNKSRGM